MSGVDGNLKVYGLERLRIADGIDHAPCHDGQHHRPCVIIGERTGQISKTAHSL